MAYNARWDRAFSQIAYMDLSESYEFHSSDGTNPVPLSDLLSKKDRSTLKDMGITDKEIDSWSIAAVHDTNAKNGFYSCVIVTGEGEAAMAFRGSESFGTENWMPDWVKADMYLINGDATRQQQETEVFLKEIAGRDDLKDYHFTTVGHSLGGNLSEYAAIVSDQYGLDDNIDSCVSLDGPGFSEKFIREHREQIEKMGEKITHYRWSFVGSMLHDLPIGSEHYQYVDVSDDATDKSRKGDPYNIVTRHDSKYTVIEGESFQTVSQPDPLAFASGILTRVLDRTMSARQKLLALTAIGFFGQILFTVKEFYDRTTLKRIKDNLQNHLSTSEAAANPAFYIDPEAFERLARQSGTGAASLSGIAVTLRTLGSRPSFSIPTVSSPQIQTMTEWINGLLVKLDRLTDAAFQAADMSEESAETLKGVKTYLLRTAEEMKLTEDKAVSIINAWEDQA